MAQSQKTPTQARTESDLYFGPFRLESTKRLWQGEQLVNVRPRPLAVLRYLAERPGRLTTGEDLLKRLWPGIYVTKTVLRVCVRELRQSLNEDPSVPQFIETVGRQGYRFIAPISTTAPPVISGQWAVGSADKEKTQLPQPGTAHGQLETYFVGRRQELARLHEVFERVRRGERQIMFLLGESGIGKTRLVDRFLDQVRTSEPVRIGQGHCVEQYGSGEAYLPLLEALSQLCREPGGEQVLTVLRRYAPTWLTQMPGLLKASELEAVRRQGQGINRERMLRELAEAIEAIAADAVLVLVLEDLQWSDPSTLDALAYLAQRRRSVQLYILSTYRPADVVMSGHPLRQVVQELYGRRQCEELALELLSEADVEEYLQQRAGRRAAIPKLSQMIYRRTDGNALFMVSFVEYLLQQGLLAKDEDQGQQQGVLSILRRFVPKSSQQVVLRQIERLSADEQQLLRVASVGGMTFTGAEVAGMVEGVLEEVEEVYDRLASREQLIAVVGIAEWPDGTVTVRYEFRHTLYQQVLYEQIGETRRVRLHRQLGEWKEGRYGEQAKENASELTIHFTEGRDYRRAVQYLYQVAETALRRSAYSEATAHCHKGLELLQSFPDTPERQRQELALRMILSAVLAPTKGYGAEELIQNLSRARKLCQLLNDDATLVSVLVGLGRAYDLRADPGAIESLVDEECGLLQRIREPMLLIQLYTHLGTSSLIRGALVPAQEYHARALELYRPEWHEEFVWRFGMDPAVTAGVISAWSLWFAGWPDQARSRMKEGLNRAQELGHPYSYILALLNSARVQLWCGDFDEALRLVAELEKAAGEHDAAWFVALGAMLQANILVQREEPEIGLAVLTERLPRYRDAGVRYLLPLYLSSMADAYRQVGRIEEGLATVAEAVHTIETSATVFWAAEVHRLKGELTLQYGARDWGLGTRGEARQKSKGKRQKAKIETSLQHLTPSTQVEAEAEACFLKAIEIARTQQARSLELRATVSLARFWQRQGKHHEARTTLSAIYGWFTEGFDTKDLREAKVLLDALRA